MGVLGTMLVLWMTVAKSFLVGDSKQNDDELPFYTVYKYYDETTKKLLRAKGVEDYTILMRAHIDPKNTGDFDENIFVNSIHKFFPNEKDNSLLCLDLENKLFEDLKKEKGNPEYKHAIERFIKMVSLAKKLRPHLKIGIYGLPFRVFWEHTRVWNEGGKLDPLLQNCDVIFPSLYVLYPAKEIGLKKNLLYLEENLQCALEVGARLKKPVIPFIWNVVHPSNRRHGGELVDVDELLEYVNLIRSYTYKNEKVKGIIWWEPDPTSFKKMVKSPSSMSKDEFHQNEMTRRYIERIVN